MMKYAVLALALGVAAATEAETTLGSLGMGASMGGKAKNSYASLMCSQDPTSWFCISNAQRENLIKLRRQGCTEMECPNTHVFKPNVASLYCKAMRAPKQMGQHMCDPEKDVEVCCDLRAECTTYTCPYGYAKSRLYDTGLCAGPECSFVDVNTCCEKPEVSCSQVKFKETPEGTEDEPRPSQTSLRSCAAEAKDNLEGTASIAGTFLGSTAPAKKGGKPEQCFALKLEKKANLGTTRIPVMPGPPESGVNYGRPSPRPMMRVDGDMVVVDQASRGAEDDQCVGFMCEEGGEFSDAEDAEWMKYLDISWNSLTGDCYSCFPENQEAGQPSTFHVSRDAETMEPVEGDKIYDCDCPDGYYLNARKTGGACVEFVPVGEECFPNYGEDRDGPYFPCKPDEAMCAHGICVEIENVIWDCETGAACDPNQLELCSVVDDCGICGGDGLSCLDCETCYSGFRDYMVGGASKGCQLKDDQELMEEFDIAWIKKDLGRAKSRMNNPKSVAQRDEATAAVIKLEGSCDGDGVTPCNPKDEEPCACLGGKLTEVTEQIAALDDQFKAALVESSATTGCDERCWQSVKNDCDRPSLCLVGYADECAGAFSQGGCDIMTASSEEQKAILAKIEELEASIAATKLEIAQKGMAIQEVVGKLDAPAGYFAGLDMTEADAAVEIDGQDWASAYASYEQSAQSVKATEEELWQTKQEMKHAKVYMKHDLENLPNMQWKCFGCWAELGKSQCGFGSDLKLML
jgi:hypothetical protein